MAITVAVTNTWSDGKRQHVIGTFTASGSYATGGDAIAWTDFAIKSATAPLNVQAVGKAGFIYQYDRANAKLMVRGQQPTSATAGVIALDEIAAASYPAGVTGDVIDFHAIFNQLV